MVLLLARCWDYKLKTEDVLELTRGDRRVALCTVVGLLEDGETYSTEVIIIFFIYKWEKYKMCIHSLYLINISNYYN